MNDKIEEILGYRANLKTEVENAFPLYGEIYDEAFTRLFMNELEGADLIEDYDITFYKGGTGFRDHQGILGAYSYSETDGIFNIFVPLYVSDNANIDSPLSTEEVRRVAIQPALNFIEDRTSIREKLSEATACLDCIDSIDENLNNIKRLRIYIVTNQFVGNKAKTIRETNIIGKTVDFVIYDIQNLYAFSTAQQGRGSLQIDFSQYSPSIRCVKVNTNSLENSKYDSYIGVVPGSVLATIYDKYGARLLEGNVRSFLTSKVATNKKIRETLLRTPERFFAFNNGISVTAENVNIDDNGHLLYAEEFQIINGGQTTASISQVRFKDKADLSKVSVLMKLTVTKNDVEDDEKQQLLENISRASNQQNKVSEADFFSTHPFHKAMEKLYINAPTPTPLLQTYWFYERAKGQYNQRQLKMTPKQKESFKKEYPKRQVITKTDLAKYRNSWDMLPFLVSKGAQTNFQKFAEVISSAWEKDSTIFNNVQFYKETVALAIMFNGVGEIVSAQAWYNGAFRANIVTYSIAMLHYLIKKQYPESEPNLEIIWRLQRLPDFLQQTFIRLTKVVNDVIVDTQNGIVNITQRCKQEHFWTTMRETITFNLQDIEGFTKFLHSASQSKKIKNEAKKQGKLLNDVEALEMVINKGQGFWKHVRTFIEEKSKNVLLLKKEDYPLSFICKNGFVNDAKHAVLLLDLLRRCEEDGFKE